MKQTDEPSVLHSSSSAELSDIEHAELISQYGNDQYLRKWSLGDQEKHAAKLGDEEKKDEVFVPHQLSGSRLTGETIPAGDCDGVSLLSFNSVQDCSPSSSSTRFNPVTNHPAYQSQDGLDFKIWQGYGGNIYFEPMRCNTMTIYSVRPPKISLRPELKLWKSKSHLPEKRSQRSSIEKRARDAASVSVQSLGSLRIKAHEERVQSYNTECSAKTSGKICKGFSKKLLAESSDTSHRYLRCESAPELMQITGGHMNNQPTYVPIHKVQLYNSELVQWPRNNSDELTSSRSFPTLSANMVSFSNAQCNQQNVVTGPFVKLPQVDSHLLGKIKKAPKKRTQCVDAARDGSQMLTIPFGAFDEPVEVDSTSDQLPRRKCIEENIRADASSARTQELAKSEKGDRESCKKILKETHQISSGNETITCKNTEAQQCYVTHTGIKGESTSPVAYQNPQSTNLCLRREISNVSLSNYLKAVPTQVPKTSEQRLAHEMPANIMPRLSYTQRTKARPSLYISNSMHHITHPFGSNASGYVPCKGKQSSSSGTSTGQQRTGGKYMYIPEFTGQGKQRKSSEAVALKRARDSNPRSQDSLVHTKSENCRKLSQALLGHQLIKS